VRAAYGYLIAPPLFAWFILYLPATIRSHNR